MDARAGRATAIQRRARSHRERSDRWSAMSTGPRRIGGAADRRARLRVPSGHAARHCIRTPPVSATLPAPVVAPPLRSHLHRSARSLAHDEAPAASLVHLAILLAVAVSARRRWPRPCVATPHAPQPGAKADSIRSSRTTRSPAAAGRFRTRHDRQAAAQERSGGDRGRDLLHGLHPRRVKQPRRARYVLVNAGRAPRRCGFT